MPWVRIDEEFPDHPKVVGAGPLGIAMQVAALCYSNRHLTDGFVPRSAARRLIDLDGLPVTPDDVIGALLTVGMWTRADGGYRIHDYDKYQFSRDEVEARRQAEHDAKAAGGRARAAGAKRDKGRFVKDQVNTRITSSPPADDPAAAPAGNHQPTSPVPETVTKGITPFPSLQVDLSQGCNDDNPKNRTQREGKAPPSTQPPRKLRHPADRFVLERARQVQAEDGPEAALAYRRTVEENYGPVEREETLRRMREADERAQREAAP